MANSEQIKLVKHYFNADIDEYENCRVEGYTFAAFSSEIPVLSKFAECSKCCAIVSVDKVIQHSEWHERLIVG